mgnify:CR=1 FL=1
MALKTKNVPEFAKTAFLTHKGKMLGDLRVLATDDELLLDTERVALQALFDMIRRFKVGFDVELHKRTLQSGLLSLVGPESRDARPTADDSAMMHCVLPAESRNSANTGSSCRPARPATGR